jgi:hypothetical protein
MAQRNIDRLMRESDGACEFHLAQSVGIVPGTAQAS